MSSGTSENIEDAKRGGAVSSRFAPLIRCIACIESLSRLIRTLALLPESNIAYSDVFFIKNAYVNRKRNKRHTSRRVLFSLWISLSPQFFADYRSQETLTICSLLGSKTHAADAQQRKPGILLHDCTAPALLSFSQNCLPFCLHRSRLGAL